MAIIFIPNLFKSKTPKDSGTMTPETTQVVVTPEAVDVVNGEITVEAGSFYYKPNLIKVKKGEKVKLTLNSASMMHDFKIDELGIEVPVTKSGSSSTVEFTVDKVGEFEFYCSVGAHKANGQVGKLIVTE
jgi:heme/copper-type cytochrome/quinol oxidase subunit 2